MKDLYFSHDRNALNDNKIAQMRGSYGIEGYGVYWAIIEALSREPELSLEYSARMIAGLTALIQPSFDMQSYIDECIEIGLFECDGERFWSNSLKRRLGEVQEQTDRKTRSASKAANARWKKEKPSDSCVRNANAMPAHEKKDATAMRPHFDRNTSAIRTDCAGNADAMRIDANENKNKNKSISASADIQTRGRAREEAANELVIDPEWKRVADAYLAEIGMIPGGTAGQALVSYCEDIGADAMIYAIQRTNQAQPDSPYKFLKSILDDYADNNVHSLAEAEARSRDFDRHRRSRASPSPSPPAAETDDEPVRWL
nr:MAG TPA: protein of unknown function (DUF4373) [Caudoviricetes sp.]